MQIAADHDDVAVHASIGSERHVAEECDDIAAHRTIHVDVAEEGDGILIDGPGHMRVAEDRDDGFAYMSCAGRGS